jgi:hypothetical protein
MPTQFIGSVLTAILTIIMVGTLGLLAFWVLQSLAQQFLRGRRRHHR